MNRRGFLSALVKTTAAIAVVSVLPKIKKVVTNFNKSKVIFSEIEINGKTYWYDHDMFIKQKEWIEEKEKDYWRQYYGIR
jgi:hypothetical protein